MTTEPPEDFSEYTQVFLPPIFVSSIEDIAELLTVTDGECLDYEEYARRRREKP